MGWFRRSRGRHARGAPVTSIPPVLPAVSVLPPVPVRFPVPVLPPVSSVRTPGSVLPAASPSAPLAALPPLLVPVQPVLTGPRVELGFADGSYALLDPGSEQVRAIVELTQVLTERGPASA